MQLVKGHTYLHTLARQSISPPPDTSIVEIALPSGTNFKPKAWGGVGTAGIN